MSLGFLFENGDEKKIGKERAALIAAVLDPMIPAQNSLMEVRLVSSEEIRDMNLALRSVDAATDVLSLPLYDGPLPATDQPIILGSVVICPDKAVEYGETLPQLLVHGALHILGLDHEADRQTWLAREALIIQELQEKGLQIRGIEQW